jgi:hypothetical protein
VDDAATLKEDTTTTVNVLANDVDPEGNLDPSTVRVLTGTRNGTATANPDGTVTYKPNANFNGSDSFTYRVCDTDGDCSNAATVKMTVTPVDEAKPRCTIRGNDRDNNIKGTAKRDVICGRGGNDTIRGMGCNDLIFGNAGNDTIQGNGGDDTIYGGGGEDTIQGNDGNDRIYGGEKGDLLQGNDGRDTIRGGGGDDTIQGGAGDDDIDGGVGTTPRSSSPYQQPRPTPGAPGELAKSVGDSWCCGRVGTRRPGTVLWAFVENSLPFAIRSSIAPRYRGRPRRNGCLRPSPRLQPYIRPGTSPSPPRAAQRPQASTLVAPKNL